MIVDPQNNEVNQGKPHSLRIWKTLTKTVILSLNKFLTVESHEILLPDGKIIPDWAWIISPNVVIVMAMTEENNFLFFRQTKYAIEDACLAPVGGMMEPDEEPLDAAKRELLEETGYTATEWVPLGSSVLDPNRGIATINLFLALKIRQTACPDVNQKDLEDQELVFLSQKEVREALRAGEIKAIQWISAAAMALNYLSDL